mgnify:CR=1 FL=1
MYFTNTMFNSQYVNPYYYSQQQSLIQQYDFQQNSEVMKAARAVSDLFKAVKKMDGAHQQEAFYACLAVFAREYGW